MLLCRMWRTLHEVLHWWTLWSSSDSRYDGIFFQQIQTASQWDLAWIRWKWSLNQNVNNLSCVGLMHWPENGNAWWICFFIHSWIKCCRDTVLENKYLYPCKCEKPRASANHWSLLFVEQDFHYREITLSECILRVAKICFRHLFKDIEHRYLPGYSALCVWYVPFFVLQSWSQLYLPIHRHYALQEFHLKVLYDHCYMMC